MKEAAYIVILSCVMAVVLFAGSYFGCKSYMKANKFNEYAQIEAKRQLSKAAEDLSFLPPDGVTIKKGTASEENWCRSTREESCSAAMKLVPKERCANKDHLVDALPLTCDCTSNGRCQDEFPWQCVVAWSFICDTNTECTKHSDCPGKGWICRERRCEKHE